MVQEAAERLMAGRLNPDARKMITNLVNLAAAASVIDPDTGAPFTPLAAVSERRVSLTRAAVAEFKTQPHTPELMTSVFQRISAERGAKVGLVVEVTSFPFSQEQLAASEAKGNRFGYLPAGLETQADRHKLGRIFPKMQSQSVQEGNVVTNDAARPAGLNMKPQLMPRTPKLQKLNLWRDSERLEDDYLVRINTLSPVRTANYLQVII